MIRCESLLETSFLLAVNQNFGLGAQGVAVDMNIPVWPGNGAATRSWFHSVQKTYRKLNPSFAPVVGRSV